MTGPHSSEAGLSCIFCQIVEGTSPSYVVYEDQHTLAFLDIDPVAYGHTLVVPRRHSRSILDIDPDDAAAVMRSAVDVARLLQVALVPEGFSLFQANERAGWQEVFHLHLHVIPRWLDDDLVPPWRPGTLAGVSLDEVAARVGARARPTSPTKVSKRK
jgi:histidine triad (HIT) family protein